MGLKWGLVVFGKPCFWAKNGGVAIDYFRLTIEYWAKIKGGAEKKDEKLKKKLQNDKEKRKKRKKRRKIEKNDAKSRTKRAVFSKSGIGGKI